MRLAAKSALALTALVLGWCLFAGSPQAADPADKASPPLKQPGAAGRNPVAVAALIDREIDKRLAESKIAPSAPADDAGFLRRACLDITGRIPTAERAAAFADDIRTDKRTRLIEDLLASPDYGQNFANLWYHRLIKPDDDNRQLISAKFHEWLAERFNDNAGWNKLVADILNASGDRDANPAAVFYLSHVGGSFKKRPEPNQITSSVASNFLGVQLQCCECHNHPFTKWKQTDFWGMAAFFNRLRTENSSQMDLKDGKVPAVQESATATAGGLGKGGAGFGKGFRKGGFGAGAVGATIVIPDSKGKTVRAKFLEGEEPALGGRGVLRPVFTGWATNKNNPFFAKAAVNRLWAHFFGRGLVNPVDDMRTDNPPSHPELLTLLADEFAASGFDLKHLARCICSTQAYQRSSIPTPANKADEELLSRMTVKVMSPDMLLDSLQVATGRDVASLLRADGLRRGPGGGAGFGRPAGGRNQFRIFFNGEDEPGATPDYNHGIPQVLRLMNARRLTDGSEVIEKLVKTGASDDKVIEGLYWACLSRRPTAAETKRMIQFVDAGYSKSRGYADVMWVLLNSSEFLLNR